MLCIEYWASTILELPVVFASHATLMVLLAFTVTLGTLTMVGVAVSITKLRPGLLVDAFPTTSVALTTILQVPSANAGRVIL